MQEQRDMEFKKLKRAFSLLEEQNSQLEISLRNSQKAPGPLPDTASKLPGNLKPISPLKYTELLSHSKAVLDKIIRADPPSQTRALVESSFSIILNTQAAFIITLTPDRSAYARLHPGAGE